MSPFWSPLKSATAMGPRKREGGFKVPISSRLDDESLCARVTHHQIVVAVFVQIHRVDVVAAVPGLPRCPCLPKVAAYGVLKENEGLARAVDDGQVQLSILVEVAGRHRDGVRDAVDPLRDQEGSIAQGESRIAKKKQRRERHVMAKKRHGYHDRGRVILSTEL